MLSTHLCRTSGRKLVAGPKIIRARGYVKRMPWIQSRSTSNDSLGRNNDRSQHLYAFLHLEQSNMITFMVEMFVV